MLNGTEVDRLFSALCISRNGKQGVFPESPVRHVYCVGLGMGIFHAKYVRAGKGLKGSIKPNTLKLANFCRSIPFLLWGGSLPAVARGGMLCQLAGD